MYDWDIATAAAAAAQQERAEAAAVRVPPRRVDSGRDAAAAVPGLNSAMQVAECTLSAEQIRSRIWPLHAQW